ncbi:MAG: M20/M25/M40 family metallo-hydrolase [Xanthomonadales bacterium]|nr:M20/M25/M40 family metallo-hydrolase [Xanthomonadales bacterium]
MFRIHYRIKPAFIRPVAGVLLGFIGAVAASDTTDVATVAASVAEHRAANEQAIIDDFVALLRLPNVATDSENIERNAEFIVSYLDRRGLNPRLLRVPGSPPAVYAERPVAGAERTIMVYVHYDGQPVDAENWASDPWQPIMRDALVEQGGVEVPMTTPFDPTWRIFARSAGDDKAPIIAIAHALDALEAVGLEPRVNLKFFFEGEEEIGSPHLREMLAAHRDLLAADLWLFCDGPMHPTRRPQLAYGVRGAAGFDITVYGPSRPLHSGHYGNWAPNPIAMLTALLSSMRNEQGDILIEGFHDEVREPSALELAAIERIPAVDLALRQDLSLARTEGHGERIEAAILRPALNFRGLSGGGVGDQSRNIIIPEATASIGIRLVPDQTVEHLRGAIERHLRAQGYHVVDEPASDAVRSRHPKVVWLRWSGGYPALRTPFDHPLVSDLAELLNEWSGDQLIQLPTMGGSLPLYLINEVLGAPVVILPIANHDNNQHGKNENLRLKNLWDAIEIYAIAFTGL